MSLKDNLDKIKAGLPPGVTLVAVSKTKPPSLIMEAYEAGHRDFGENYVQELIVKQELLPKDIRWHFIGHLQSNKVKYIAPFVHLVHGVDSENLLKEISKQGIKNGRTIGCLLQLHVAAEETKYGFSFEECGILLRSGAANEIQNVLMRGFMTMASNTGDVSRIREEFRSVKLFQQKMLPFCGTLTTLSMGMSGDYGIALEEGANMIRVGSLIFGERHYND